jgi:hypothetical protein
MARLVLVAAFLAFVVWLFSSSFIFRIEFKGGIIQSVRGRVAGPLRRGFEEVARHAGITGTVSLHHGRILRFSRGVAADDRQRFQNVLSSLL